MFSGISDVHLSLDESKPVVCFSGDIVFDNGGYTALANSLRESIRNSGEKTSCVVEIPSQANDGVVERWRATSMMRNRYACRKIRAVVPQLSELNIPNGVVSELLTSDLKKSGGLVMISGLTGSGKTTTYSATIKQRLKLHGGYALTIENPIEDILEGVHGVKGYCEQLEAADFGGYASAISVAMRCFPAKDNSILGYGEVINEEEAAQLLRIAVDGHLVIFTCHAMSISTAMRRVVSLAEAAGEANAAELLASSFRLAIHQKFEEKSLVVSALNRAYDPSLISFLKDKKYDAIEQKVTSCTALLSRNKSK